MHSRSPNRCPVVCGDVFRVGGWGGGCQAICAGAEAERLPPSLSRSLRIILACHLQLAGSQAQPHERGWWQWHSPVLRLKWHPQAFRPPPCSSRVSAWARTIGAQAWRSEGMVPGEAAQAERTSAARMTESFFTILEFAWDWRTVTYWCGFGCDLRHLCCGMRPSLPVQHRGELCHPRSQTRQCLPSCRSHYSPAYRRLQIWCSPRQSFTRPPPEVLPPVLPRPLPHPALVAW